MVVVPYCTIDEGSWFFFKKQIHRKNNNLIFLGLPRISLNNLGSFKVCIKITLKSNLLSEV
jgi:hypothetical protein